MGWRSTLVLALLILVVGTYLWMEEAPPPQRGTPPTLLGEPLIVDPHKPVRHLLNFEPQQVLGIQLQRGSETRASARTSGKWQGTPNGGAIDDFLHSLAELGIVLDIPEGSKQLKDYGLEPPQSVVELRTPGRSTPLILEIGDRNPAVTGVYVRIGRDGPVALAGALVLWEFDKAFNALGEPS
jgi:Domain of unknown function (DUF4340)